MPNEIVTPLTEWYRGWKLGERPSRWKHREGYRVILASKCSGKMGAYVPVKEWHFKVGDTAGMAEQITKAKIYIDKMIDG